MAKRKNNKANGSKLAAKAQQAGAGAPAQVLSLPGSHPHSPSAEFFAKEEDPMGRGVEMESFEEPAPREPAHVVARRARFRRIVAVGLTACALFALGAAGKAFASRSAQASETPWAAGAQLAPAMPEPARPAAPAVAVTSTAESASRQVELAKPEAASVAAADGDKLRKQAEALLNRGKWKDAAKTAQEAIEADPSHANSYLFLGTALQMTGKWSAGVAAYSQCVRNATRGPIHECRASGGRK